MKHKEAIKILRLLREHGSFGYYINLPEPLTPEEEDVQHALKHAITAIKYTARHRQDRKTNTRSGRPWYEKEDRALKEAWLNGEGILTIQKRHKRSLGAIQSRAEKLLIND